MPRAYRIFICPSKFERTDSYNHQVSHGGIEWSDPGYETHPEWRPIHDRISKEHFGQLGGNISYSATERIGIYIGYFQNLRDVSENTQQVNGFNMGTTTRF